MSKVNELYAYFSVKGMFSPEEITTRLGIVPTITWALGDLNPHNQKTRSCSRWSLYSRLERSCALEEHVCDVLAQLQANREGVREVALEYEGVLELVGYFHSAYPGLALHNDDLSEIADLGMSMDFDFYYLYSNYREDTD